MSAGHTARGDEAGELVGGSPNKWDRSWLRDVINMNYFTPTCRAIQLFNLVATLFLFLYSFSNPKVVTRGWYIAFEGVLTALFAAEVIMRILASQQYFASVMNIAEAVMCAICSVGYISIVVSSAAVREEHEVFLAVRYLAQLLRLGTFCRASAQRPESIVLDVIPAGAGGTIPLGDMGGGGGYLQRIRESPAASGVLSPRSNYPSSPV